MQGDVIGCFLHMPEGGRAFEKEKSVRHLTSMLSLPTVTMPAVAVQHAKHPIFVMLAQLLAHC